MLTNSTNITIEEWESQNAQWPELLALVTQLNQSDWLNFTADWYISSHVLVARAAHKLLAFYDSSFRRLDPMLTAHPSNAWAKTFEKLRSLPLASAHHNGDKELGENSKRPCGNRHKP